MTGGRARGRETCLALPTFSKVERSHRIDHEEFWSRQTFPDFDAASAALRGWEATYNYQRLSLALKGWTPAEKLAATLPPSAA